MNMSVLNAPKTDSNESRLFFEQTERNVIDYINHVKKSEWSYHFNRVFISPGRSFNTKYIIKCLLSKSARPKPTSSRTRVSSSGSNDAGLLTTSRQKRPKAAPSRPAVKSNAVTNASKVDDLIGNEYEYDVCDILDGLNDNEWFRLLNVDAGKRMETLVRQYRAYDRTLAKMPFEKLDKLHYNVHTEVPYVIYTETAEDNSMDTKNWDGYSVNTVDSYDVLGTLKTCGVVVIDVSRDVAALSKGRETFRSFRRELVNDMDGARASNGQILIVVISTVMTWTGVSRGHVLHERDADGRTPNAQCADHYEFELEVLAVNKTKGLKEIVTTTVVWTGITYGHEQDLLRFAFDAARKSAYDGDAFPIPKSRNYVPVVHVENLARHVCVRPARGPADGNRLRSACSQARPQDNIRKPPAEGPGRFRRGNADVHVETDNHGHRQGVRRGRRAGVRFVGRVPEQARTPERAQTDAVDGRHSEPVRRPAVAGFRVVRRQTVHGAQDETADGAVREENDEHTGARAAGLRQNRTRAHARPALRFGVLGARRDRRQPRRRDQLTELRKAHPLMYSYDSADDDDDDDEDRTGRTEVDALAVERMNALDDRLKRLYASVDDNGGTLGDVHLIPLLKAEMSRAASSKRGYVLDGWPKTADQARSMFGDADADALPDLTVNVDGARATTASEATGRGRTVFFSDVNTTYSRDFELAATLATLATTTMTTAADVRPITRTPTRTRTRERPAWDAHRHDGLLKTLNRYYVPAMTLDCSPLTTDADAILESRADAVDEQMLLWQRDVSLSDQQPAADPDETTSPAVERSTVEPTANGPRRLCEKMTLLDELGKVTDTDHVDRLLTDEYLMRHVTPTLTKLLARVAEVRPENAVEFLAYAAVGQNAEGTAECPERSDEGVRIQRLLERAVRVLGADDGTLKGYLAEHSIAGPDGTDGNDANAAIPSSGANSAAV